MQLAVTAEGLIYPDSQGSALLKALCTADFLATNVGRTLSVRRDEHVAYIEKPSIA